MKLIPYASGWGLKYGGRDKCRVIIEVVANKIS